MGNVFLFTFSVRRYKGLVKAILQSVSDSKYSSFLTRQETKELFRLNSLGKASVSINTEGADPIPGRSALITTEFRELSLITKFGAGLSGYKITAIACRSIRNSITVRVSRNRPKVTFQLTFDCRMSELKI